MRIRILSIFSFLLFTLAAVIFYEFFLRYTEISLPSFVYDDPKLGRMHKPDSKYLSILAEGFGIGQVNNLGYLGPAYPQEKKSNTLRIALVGDSYVEGIQVLDRQHFRNLIENDLSAMLNKNVEVLNFGIGGNDLRRIFINIKYRVFKYNPDIILVFLRRGNLLEKDVIPGPELEIDNDSLILNYDYIKSDVYKIRNRFKFLRLYSIGNLIKETYEEFYNQNYSKVLFGKFYDWFSNESIKKPSPEITMDKDIYYNLNKKIFNEFREINKHSSTKIFVVETNGIPGYYISLLDSVSVPVLTLIDYLSGFKEKDIYYWKGSRKSGHWNHRAHQMVSKFLSAEIYDHTSKSDSLNN